MVNANNSEKNMKKLLTVFMMLLSIILLSSQPHAIASDLESKQREIWRKLLELQNMRLDQELQEMREQQEQRRSHDRKVDWLEELNAKLQRSYRIEELNAELERRYRNDVRVQSPVEQNVQLTPHPTKPRQSEQSKILNKVVGRMFMWIVIGLIVGIMGGIYKLLRKE